MFELFRSFFGLESHAEESVYPDVLIEKAIERALEATDPRIRAVSGYERALRPAVIHAIDHVVAMVEALPPAREADPERYGEDPELTAFFASKERLQQCFSFDSQLRDYLDAAGELVPDRFYALLVMARSDKRVLGMEMQGEMLRRDVAQVMVNFSGHRLVDPSGSEAKTRRELKRRAFDSLLEIALHRLVAADQEHAELKQQHYLLQRKLRALRAGRWGLDDDATEEPLDAAGLERHLAAIEQELNTLVEDEISLTGRLDTLTETLNTAEKQLWGSRIKVIMDRSGIKRDQASFTAPELELDEIHSILGRSATLFLVSYPTAELLPRPDLLTEASRYLF